MTPREQIRLWKNYWLQQYLECRLNQNADPLKVAFRKKPYQCLWILSHMRSGSSLLTHILNTNPEIAGYGESHIRYNDLEDFKTLFRKVYWVSQEYRNWQDLKKLKLSETYILDKLLHNSKLTNLELLLSERIHVIFLVREPQRSLNSIRDLKSHWSEEETFDYYCNRLRTLVSYAETVATPHRALFITYDQVINHSFIVFDALQQFLGTQTGFSEEYQILKTTGTKHIGDSRGKILAGKIVKTQRELQQSVSLELIEQAQEVYGECCDRLSKLATTIRVPRATS